MTKLCLVLAVLFSSGCSRPPSRDTATGRGATTGTMMGATTGAVPSSSLVSVPIDSLPPDTPPHSRSALGRGPMGGRPGMMRGGSGMRGMGMPMMMNGAPSDTAAAPKPRAAEADAVTRCPRPDQKLVDRGRAVFSTTGNCYACHGPNASGTVLAPNLTDATWLNIDGSYASIVELVRKGVPKPKEHQAPMPPEGGASLSESQVCAVAAYVFSLGHR